MRQWDPESPRRPPHGGGGSGREGGCSTDTYKPEWSDEVCFGWNLCCDAKAGSKIRVGDVVTVIKRRDFVKSRE